MKQLKIYPNTVTIIGIIVRLITLFNLSIGNKRNFFIGAVFSYFLDCLDGNYARNYNMCTVLGDYLDHFSDLFFHIIILYHLFFQSSLWKSNNFYPILVMVIALGTLMCWHFGYQEHHYESKHCESHTLKFLKCFATEKNKHFISISRFFGCGTVALIIYGLVYYY